MRKTLDDAIGCWTTSDDGLGHSAAFINQSVRNIQRATKKNTPLILLTELKLLHRRLNAMTELALHASVRCQNIIETNEVTKERSPREDKDKV
jgi:hypothetical protein